MNDTLKLEREKFVSGHSGCGLWETLLYSFGPVVSIGISSQLRALFRVHSQLLGASLDWLALSLLILHVTVLAEVSNLLCFVLFTVFSVLVFINQVFNFKERLSASYRRSVLNPKLVFHDMRALLLVVTCVFVLAVDFPIFPRRLAKTEVYGVSPMDMGAGSFTFAAGLLAGLSFSTFGRTVRTSLPLIGLGLVRTAAVKLLNYQEHVTEYGVHWNFFLTLGVMRVLGHHLVRLNLQLRLLAMFLLSAACVYLSSDLMSSVVMNDDRSSLIMANKEGLVSLPGHLLVYLYASSISRLIMAWKADGELGEFVRTVIVLPMISLLSALLTLAVAFFSPDVAPSRRLSNLSHVAVICFSNSLVLAGVSLVKTCAVQNTKALQFPLLRRLASFAMPYFLLFNLLTGVTNFSFTTTTASVSSSLTILFGYYFVSTGSFIFIKP